MSIESPLASFATQIVRAMAGTDKRRSERRGGGGEDKHRSASLRAAEARPVSNASDQTTGRHIDVTA